MKTPYYMIEEQLLRRNLALISDVARRTDSEWILAFKAFALWKTFPIFKEYIHSTTASSLSEARLAFEEFGAKAHTYSPAYKDDEFDEIVSCSSHLTFNSLSQYERFHQRATACSIGLRVNPEYSEVGTMLYNPCAPGTRFGVTADKLPEQLPGDIRGFHCHCHCESGADVFQRSLKHIEEKFSRWFPQLEWINFGGGHLVTRSDYDIELLVSMMQAFHARWPHLKVIFEPGSAFAWQTGPLVAQVVDVVEDKGIRTAILDVSFTCHMPDCLEMPYFPEVRGAVFVESGKWKEESGDDRGLNKAPSDPQPPNLGGLNVELKMDLYHALALLKPDERTCITLQLVDGYDISKIGEITQIKEGTVKSHLSRGKEKLANYLKQNGYG